MWNFVRRRVFRFFEISVEIEMNMFEGMGVNLKVITLCKSVHKSNNGNERIENDVIVC